MKAKDIIALGDPWRVFSSWYEEVRQNPAIKEPTAMALATATAQGVPSVRMVLLKQFSEAQGMVFYTNYESQKARELTENDHAALLFYWDPLFRQVKVEGEVQRISRQESEAYWNSRPWESQLAGLVSKQSQPVAGFLDEELESARKKWAEKKIPCPENWGGFALRPDRFEFWVGHRFRMHDRVRFTRAGAGWAAGQLYP